MQIRTYTISPMVQNARFILDSNCNEAALIDPGYDADLLFEEAQKEKWNVTQIILTHSHLDHAGGVAPYIESCKAHGHPIPKLLGHPLGTPLRQNIEQIAYMYGITHGFYNCPEPDRLIDDGDKIQIGGLQAKVLFIPGHSPDHIVLYFEEEAILIAGDTLFAGSIGRTDFPNSDHNALITNIHSKLFPLPDHTKVLPGHGPNTTIGIEKTSNPFL